MVTGSDHREMLNAESYDGAFDDRGRSVVIGPAASGIHLRVHASERGRFSAPVAVGVVDSGNGGLRMGGRVPQCQPFSGPGLAALWRTSASACVCVVDPVKTHPADDGHRQVR